MRNKRRKIRVDFGRAERYPPFSTEVYHTHWVENRRTRGGDVREFDEPLPDEEAIIDGGDADPWGHD